MAGMIEMDIGVGERRPYDGYVGVPDCQLDAVIRDVPPVGNGLILASANGHEAIVRILLEQGANLNIQGKSTKKSSSRAPGKQLKIVILLTLKLKHLF